MNYLKKISQPTPKGYSTGLLLWKVNLPFFFLTWRSEKKNTTRQYVDPTDIISSFSSSSCCFCCPTVLNQPETSLKPVLVGGIVTEPIMQLCTAAPAGYEVRFNPTMHSTSSRARRGREEGSDNLKWKSSILTPPRHRELTFQQI